MTRSDRFSVLVPCLVLLGIASPAGAGSLPDQAADQAADHAADRATLLDGVTRIARPGVPGALMLTSAETFAVVAGRSGEGLVPVVAAGRHGQGRFVAFGHGGYFDPGTLASEDTARLLANAIGWASCGTPEVRIGTWRCGALTGWLRQRHLEASEIRSPGESGALEKLDLLVTMANDLGGERGISAIRQFIRSGGGMLIVGLGWGWQQLHPRQDLRKDHPGNRLLAPLGLFWSGGYVDRIEPVAAGQRDATLDSTHAGLLLSRMERWQEGQARPDDPVLRQASLILPATARGLASDERLFMPRARRLVGAAGDATYPRPDHAVGRDDPIGRLAVAIRHLDEEQAELEAVRPAPFHEGFPGAVGKEAPRVERSISIDLAVDGWASTGLYAPAGEILSVRTDRAIDPAGLFVRVGCHSDRLWGNAEWRRDPELCRRRPLQRGTTRIVNPNGGLVYVEVPPGLSGRLDLKIDGAVQAPRFVRGETSLEAWRETLREAPAPWAELESSKIILSVPSVNVRELEDPEALMAFWDGVLDCYAELGARPLGTRPERMVTDVQISAGYMHSGYPIMMHLDVAGVVTDVEIMQGKKHGGVWGLWHELGHNHQRPEWTFAGTGEVTCNLFSLYVIEKLSGVKPMAGPEMQGQLPRIKEYLAAGAPYPRWQADPFLALAMYARVQDAFGWEPFKTVFAEYRDLPEAERPRNDQEKRDQWLVRLSRATGRNLGPYFERWGVPTSETARQSVAGLKSWLPDLEAAAGKSR